MTIWTGDAAHRFAPALLTLLQQLEAAWPGQGWLASPQTGTIGDAAHFIEGSASDHNPWLDNTVRAIDIAANVSGVPGIVPVDDAPDCEALFAMVNRMYAARDARIYPDGYAIYRNRITDWDNPGGFHAQQGDPHLYHLHISTSRNPTGFTATTAWPLLTRSPDPAPPPHPNTTTEEESMLLVHNADVRGQVGLQTSKGIAILQSPVTVAAYRAAGVPVAPEPLAGVDFAAQVRWGRM